MRLTSLALPLVLMGCVDAPAPEAQGPVVPLRFDTAGIEALGTGQRIDFGRDQAGVLATMTRLEGREPRILPCDHSTLSAARWPDGPLLVFRNSAFAGWSIGDPSLSADGRTEFGPTCLPLG